MRCKRQETSLLRRRAIHNPAAHPSTLHCSGPTHPSARQPSPKKKTRREMTSPPKSKSRRAAAAADRDATRCLLPMNPAGIPVLPERRDPQAPQGR